MFSWIFTLIGLSGFSCALVFLPTRFCQMSVEMRTTILSCALPLIVLLAASAFPGSLVLWDMPWLTFGPLTVPFGLAVDSWSLTMLLLITTIAALVHIYSWGYLASDLERPRFFGLITFFCFMMILLVLSSNLLTLFIGWEGVGVASFLLIGFWRKKVSARQASIQAFLANRLGDWAFLIALLILATQRSSWDWPSLIAAPENVSLTVLLLLGVAAITKSAQIPMNFWLPGSMEGPTPISALIHAATMVTAGIYLLIRFVPVLEQYVLAQQLTLILGCSTIVVMSLRACTHLDIKRIIAYSTMAQLGYMIVAVGLLKPDLALCHLWTHGFFKALLFLCAGGVIFVSDHQQQLPLLQGVLRGSPLLGAGFAVGLLSLIGCPGFPGFYSKELLISLSYGAPEYVTWSLKGGALLTALYSARLLAALWLCPRDSALPTHKIPLSMAAAIAALTIFTLMITPLSLLNSSFFPWSQTLSQAAWLQLSQEPLVIMVLIVMVIGSLGFAYFQRRRWSHKVPDQVPERWDSLMQAMNERLFGRTQDLRYIMEHCWENFVSLIAINPWEKVAHWATSAHQSSLRQQVISLLALMAIAAVVIEGGVCA